MTAPSSDLKPGTYKLNGGATLTVNPDGSRVIVKADGKRTVQDRFGHVIDTGDPNAGKGRTSLGPTGKTATETRKDDQAAAPAKAAADAAAKAAAQAKVDAANKQYVWLDGHRVQVQSIGTDAAGNQQYTFVTDADSKPQTYSLPTAYNALNGDAVPAANTQFLVSQGQASIWNGSAPTGGAPKLGDHSDAANTVSNGRNLMTIGQSLQWLANLSVQDPTAYGALADKLHNSGYITDAQYAQAGKGTYSQDIAAAWAKAAQDTAVVNSTQAGANTTLDQLLDQKTADRKAAAVAAVQPVDRSYQDPATLAATARAAAQSALGRKLTPQEEAAFEAHYRGLENQAFDSKDAANKAQAEAAVTNGTAPGANIAMPDSAGQADAYVQGDQFSTQRNGYSALEYMNSLQQLLGGGGGKL